MSVTSPDCLDRPEARVRLAGGALAPEVARAVYEVETSDGLDELGAFKLTFKTWDPETADFNHVEERSFPLGADMQIELGYVGATAVVAAGEITGVAAEFMSGQAPRLVVHGHDRRHRMARGDVSRSWVNATDSDIVAAVARDYGFKTGAVARTHVKYDYVLQSNVSDLAFLRHRAGRIGFELLMRDRDLIFRPHQHAAPPALDLSVRRELIELHVREDSLDQRSDRVVRGWDPAAAAPIHGQAPPSRIKATGGGDVGPAVARRVFSAAQGIWVDQPVFNPAEAGLIAGGQLVEDALGFVIAEATCYGDPRIRAGVVLNVMDAGARFSAPYYVVAARHTYSPRGYRTHFTARRTSS